MNAVSIRSLLTILVAITLSAVSFAQIGIAITIGPPPLPVYEQLCVPLMATSGRLGIGPMTMTAAITTGFPVPG